MNENEKRKKTSSFDVLSFWASSLAAIFFFDIKEPDKVFSKQQNEVDKWKELSDLICMHRPPRWHEEQKFTHFHLHILVSYLYSDAASVP